MLLAAGAAHAQSDAAPRTAWGAPDLQGVWDFRSLTPMQRPEQYGADEVLTAEGGRGFLAGSHREPEPRLGNVGPGRARAAQGDIIPYNDFWFDEGTAVTRDRPSLIVDPLDGRLPAYTAAKRRQLDEQARARLGVSSHEPTPGGFVEDLGPGGLQVRCILGFNSGPPMEPSGYNNNVQLFQTEDHVVLLTEMVHDARIVPLDGRPTLPAALRQWRGDSRGYWDGDTLVVETTNFLRETNFMQDEAGRNLKLTERFTRADADTLLYRVTVDDPTTWTRPWTYEVPMQWNPHPLYEYACHEGNYGLYNILSGAP